MGHEDRSEPSKLNISCRLDQATFAEMHGYGRNAPIEAVRRTSRTESLAYSGHSPDASLIAPIDNLWVGRVDRGMIWVEGRSRRGPQNENDARQHVSRF